jgi:hypothetical protein
MNLASTSLSRDPLADVWVALHQRDSGRFAPREKIDAVLAGQSHIPEVQNDVATILFRPFRADERFQFGNMLPVNPAAHGKDRVLVAFSVNS